jgi:hypothetical protein
LGGEQRNFGVACTRGTLTKMSMAGLIVIVTMSGTFDPVRLQGNKYFI